jgi:hypothetical protein
MTLEDIRILNDQNRKIGIPRWNNWPKEKEQTMESKEPDYSFSKEIQDALKEGKSVWINYAGTGWKEIWIDKEDDYTVREMIENKWSLEKPKEKIKKWQWIIKIKGTGVYQLTNYYIKKEDFENEDFEVIEPYLPSEIEE